MYRCEDCGAVFDAAAKHTWYSEESGDYCDSCCPECGSEEIEQVEACPACGEPMEKWDKLCPACAAAAREMLAAFVRDLSQPFAAYLDDLLETERLEEIAG